MERDTRVCLVLVRVVPCAHYKPVYGRARRLLERDRLGRGDARMGGACHSYEYVLRTQSLHRTTHNIQPSQGFLFRNISTDAHRISPHLVPRTTQRRYALQRDTPITQ